MSYLDAIILGVIQGLTEFLPISSSGHLVLAQKTLGVADPGVALEIVVHLGTLLSVLVYFRAKLWRLITSLYKRDARQDRAIVGYLIIGTIPAGLVGLLFEDFFDRAFDSPLLVSTMLLLTGAILFVSRFFKNSSGSVTLPRAVAMGLGQALAILPGVSRSGSTIVAGMASGVRPADAAEFSFLLAIPAIGGAAVLKFGDLAALDQGVIGAYLAGFIAAFTTGLMAVYVVLAVIKRGRFEYFAYYCFALGLIGLYLFR